MAAVSKFVDILIEVLVAAILFVPVLSACSDAASNTSGASATMWNLVPVLYVIVVVIGLIYQVKK